MTRDERLLLYQKLYFHEIDRRENINARLSLPFAAVLACAALLSFMLNSNIQPQAYVWRFLFWVLFAASSVALLVGSWCFRKAWYGHTDRLLPTAREIEAYRDKLCETYKDFHSRNRDALVDKHFDDFLFKYLISTSSANTINNDHRSSNILRANTGLTVAILLALAAAVPFYIGNTTSEAPQMTEPKTPPPPPPPPPERLIKDGTPKPPPKEP